MPKLPEPPMLKPELASGNAVVAARQFNPSVISQLWLVKHGIANENDFGPTCIFTPEFVQVGTTTFNLTCLREQLQLAPVGDTSIWGSVVRDRLGKILGMLPHTPFAAVGLNFIWQARLEPATAAVTTRRLFAGVNPIYNTEFDTADARFGAYLSKDYEGMRLKLDIKPLSNDGDESIQLAFNFHKPVGDNPHEEMHDALSKWNAAQQLSRQLTETILGGKVDG